MGAAGARLRRARLHGAQQGEEQRPFGRLIVRASHLRLPASALAERVAHVRVCPDHVQLGDGVLCQPSSSAVKTILIEEPN
jgi:hypothetical protein